MMSIERSALTVNSEVAEGIAKMAYFCLRKYFWPGPKWERLPIEYNRQYRRRREAKEGCGRL